MLSRTHGKREIHTEHFRPEYLGVLNIERRKRPKLSCRRLSLAPLLFLLLFLTPAPITCALTISPASITKMKSADWAGYEMTTLDAVDIITVVQGSWVVPKVTCAKGETSYASYLAGIQGDEGGAAFYCNSGSAAYSANCEFLGVLGCTGIPGTDTVSPGDEMTSDTNVIYSERTQTATVTLTDTTKAWTYTHTFTDTRALQDGFWVLSDFGHSLTKFAVLQTNGNFVTILGRNASIMSFHNVLSDVITQFSKYVNKGDPLATTSALSGATSAFSIKWLEAS